MARARVEVVLASAKALRARTTRVELALAVGAEHARAGKLPSGSRAATMSTIVFFFFESAEDFKEEDAA